jgi:hypothetical protein
MYSFFGTSARDGHVTGADLPGHAPTIEEAEAAEQDWLPADLQQPRPRPQPLSA